MRPGIYPFLQSSVYNPNFGFKHTFLPTKKTKEKKETLNKVTEKSVPFTELHSAPRMSSFVLGSEHRIIA